MIIPEFKISQTSDTVTIYITAKHSQVAELEFEIDDNEIYFYCMPYHLRLNIPGYLAPDLLTSDHDEDTGILTFVMKKMIPGQHFENLESITPDTLPHVQEELIESLSESIEPLKEIVWLDKPEESYRYGFAMKGLSDFHRVMDEFVDVVKVDPRKIDIEERLNLMRLEESQKFSVEHYIADFAEEETVLREIIDAESPLTFLSKDTLSLDASEHEVLKGIPAKFFQLTEEQTKYSFYGLIDILYAYCYDCRTTEFEGNSESSWTISEIAATLRWLVGFQDAKSTLLSCYRRSLMYPLYRNFNLCNRILRDVLDIVSLGKIGILKCLLQIHEIFLDSENRHVFNDLFINKYVHYVWNWDENQWNNVVQEVSNVVIGKNDLNMNLLEIERNFLRSVVKQDNNNEESQINDIPAELLKQFEEKLVIVEEQLKT